MEEREANLNIPVECRMTDPQVGCDCDLRMQQVEYFHGRCKPTLRFHLKCNISLLVFKKKVFKLEQCCEDGQGGREPISKGGLWTQKKIVA